MISQLTSFFIWILTISAMASVLILFIFLARSLLKDKLKPRWSYLLWILLILRLILPWTPESSFSVFNILTFEKHFSSHEQNHIIEPTEPNTELAASIQPIPSSVTQSGHPVIRSEENQITFIQILSLVWLIGAVSMLGLILVSNIRFASKIRREPVIKDVAIRSTFEQCKDDMKVKRPVALIESVNVSSPTLFGVVRPKILLPRSVINTLTSSQFRYVFLHELSHIKRNDVAVNWLMNVLLALHWFNPLLWHAYRKLRDDQEIACDSLALTRINPEETKDYALTIIKLLESFSNPIRFASAASISGNKIELKRRVIMITSFNSRSYRWSLLGLVVLFLISGCVLTNAKSNVNPQDGNVNPNGAVTVKPSEVNPDFPVPDDAVLTEGEAHNPNIIRYAKYKWQSADEIQSISEPYLQEIEASGWTEKKSEQMGAMRVFEKDGTIIVVTTHNGFFTVSELKKDNMFTNHIYQSPNGWSFEYPRSWDKAADGYVQETATGKTIVFDVANVSSHQELQEWIQSEIDRKMSADGDRTLVEPLTKNERNGLTVYRYAIYLEAGDMRAVTLSNAIFFDGRKRYAFHAAIPDVTEEEFNLMIDTFNLESIEKR